jgi:hypothetical protein
VGKFWPFSEKKKRAVTLTKDFFLQYLERKKEKIPIFRPFLLRHLKNNIAQKNSTFLLCSQNLAKSSCGRSPGHLLHKIEGEKKKKKKKKTLVR